MGIAISAGAGILLGLGLLIWGLKERSKRHAAERKADKAEKVRDQAVDTANHNAFRAVELENENVRINKQLGVYRERLAAVREKVVTNAPVSTIRALLDSESDEEVI